jgi:hypothetical protein
MEKEAFIIRSSISSKLMRKTLFQGTFLAGIGGLALFLGGILLPLQEMKVWGPLLFLFSVGMITWGLLPYKRLKRLEEKPYRLTIEDEHWLHFSEEGKPLFSIPMVSIECINFVEAGDKYGIGIFLKEFMPQKMIIEDSNFDLQKFVKRSRKQYAYDLFLPYFSELSHEELKGFHDIMWEKSL